VPGRPPASQPTQTIITTTTVTLKDTDPTNRVKQTLHLLNQYPGQFGLSASDYG
jgi:hypothetical protein